MIGRARMVGYAAFLASAVASFTAVSYAGGILTAIRYEDDFNGGPLLPWPLNAWDGEVMGPDWWFQTPLLNLHPQGTYQLPPVVNMSFDFVSESSWDVPEYLDVALRTYGSNGLGYGGELAAIAQRASGSETRFTMTAPFYDIPRQSPPPCELCPRPVYSYPVEAVIYRGGSAAYPFALDNFVLELKEPPPPPPATPAIEWDFADSQLPAGWTFSGYAGRWQPAMNASRAVKAGSPPYGASDEPELRIDAWTPLLRFTDLARAMLTLNVSALASNPLNDSLYVDVYPAPSAGLPNENAPGSWRILTVGLADLSIDQSIIEVDVAPGSELPDTYVSGETLYRIRTRVYDNDVAWNSLNYVELTNFKLTHAVRGIGGGFDSNGLGAGADLLLWHPQLGQTSGGFADANYDFIVDGADLNIWKLRYGSTDQLNVPSLGASSASVPEPAAALIVFSGLVSFARLRRRALEACRTEV